MVELRVQLSLWTYRAKVIRVVDGDTLDVRIDQGFRSWRLERLRLFGIDTPETRGEEREEGLRSKDYVQAWLEERNNDVIIRTSESDSFGRWLAKVYDEDGFMLNAELLEKGLAEKYER